MEKLLAGYENTCTLFNRESIECSLVSTVIDGKVHYIVEEQGMFLEPMPDFIAALERYNLICFRLLNPGYETATKN